ncbi:MAG: hypothetical protein ACI32A_08650, partial [Floccifex sp.]
KRAKTIELEEDDMCEALEKFRNKAIAEGMAQGIAQGISQGIAQGKAEGKLEEKVTLVQNLKKMGSEDEFIAKALNCDVDYVKELLVLN